MKITLFRSKSKIMQLTLIVTDIFIIILFIQIHIMKLDNVI